MVEDEPENQQNDATESSVFVVRLGENDDAPFAVCERVGTVSGHLHLPGAGKTVAELVAEQGLLAAAIAPGDEDDLEDLAQVATGENDLGPN